MLTRFIRLRPLLGLALALLALVAPPQASAEVYKWTDAKGMLHFSDRPPREAPAEQVAALTAEFLPDIDRGALTRTIADYQRIGCWRGDIAISRELYDRTTALFLRTGDIGRAAPYEDVIAPVPA